MLTATIILALFIAGNLLVWAFFAGASKLNEQARHDVAKPFHSPKVIGRRSPIHWKTEGRSQ